MSTVVYPPDHHAIVTALFRDGRFLVEGEQAFFSLQGNESFYRSFFLESFQLELHLANNYALLTSGQENDPLARAICVFLAILCYELDQEGKGLHRQLASGTFSIREWERRFPRSSFYNVMQATNKLRDTHDRHKFYHQMARRGLIHRIDDDTFRFTPAHQYFLEYARELNRESMAGAERG